MVKRFELDLSRANNEQVIEQFDAMDATPLRDLPGDVKSKPSGSRAAAAEGGVYLIYHHDVPAYVGKADRDVEGRLIEHRWTLLGRLGLNIDDCSYKAIGHGNPPVTEDAVIEYFKARGGCRWNTGGLGNHDQGLPRDAQEPSWFDRTFPIKDDWPVDVETGSVSRICETVKSQLPWTFRGPNVPKRPRSPGYSITPAQQARLVDLTDVRPFARDVLVKVARTLGDDFMLTLFPARMTLYQLCDDMYALGLHPKYRRGQRLV